MKRSNPITCQRKAVVYVRQSSAYQVAHNLESQRLQYGMEQRLRQLGWDQVEVVDEDLGRSADGGTTRAGFERMVADVCLGKVGAVAAREVSRFARNSREWQQLVEVCRIVDTLLIDLDTVYAPRQSNDRLLLGLKGSLNEYELDLLRQRSVEARYEKARRGELLVSVPVGFLKAPDQRVEKDPDRRVQEAIRLVFRKFEELGAVRSTLLLVPGGGPAAADPAYRWRDEVETPDVCDGLSHPHASGLRRRLRLRQDRVHDAVRSGHAPQGRPPQAAGPLARVAPARPRGLHWLGAVPADPARDRRELGRLPDVRGGQAGAGLLAGFLRCRRCGRKLAVRYTGRQHDVLRYCCIRGWIDQGEPRCIAFGGLPVDEEIGRQLLRVVQPAALEAAMAAHEEDRHRGTRPGRLWNATSKRRDTRPTGPGSNSTPWTRTIAWWQMSWSDAGTPALAQVRALEERINRQASAGEPEVEACLDDYAELARDRDAVWHSPDSDIRLKKRIVRTLIEEVIADVDASAAEIVLHIHWRGGVHTELRLPRRRRGQMTHTAQDVVAAVRSLARLCTDDVIASVLNRNGLRTGRGNRWTRERVVSLRNWHEIPCHSRERCQHEGWLKLERGRGVAGREPPDTPVGDRDAGRSQVNTRWPMGPGSSTVANWRPRPPRSWPDARPQSVAIPRETSSRAAVTRVFQHIERWGSMKRRCRRRSTWPRPRCSSGTVS